MLHPLDCYKEAWREGESRFPLYAQSDTRSLETSGRKRFYENERSFTYSLTHRFLLFIINPVKVFHACAQSKSNLPLDSCRRLGRLVSLDVRNNTIIDEG